MRNKSSVRVTQSCYLFACGLNSKSWFLFADETKNTKDETPRLTMSKTQSDSASTQASRHKSRRFKSIVRRTQIKLFVTFRTT